MDCSDHSRIPHVIPYFHPAHLKVLGNLQILALVSRIILDCLDTRLLFHRATVLGLPRLLRKLTRC